MATGQESSVDFTGLSPFDIYGSMDFVHNLLTTDLGSLIAGSPAGQLYFGNNPRITNFVMKAARYTNLVDDFTDPTTFAQVAQSFGEISSGYSAAFKAAYMLEYERKYGTLGGNTNSLIPSPNVMATAFGLASMDDARNRYVGNALYLKSKSFDDDVKYTYTQAKRHVLSKYPGIDGANFAQKVYTEAFRVYGNDNIQAKQIFDRLLRKDLSNGDASMHKRILEAGGILSHGELRELGKNLKFRDEAQRERYMESIDFMKKQATE